MSIKNDGHYFCRAGGNRPDGLNEPVTERNEMAEVKRVRENERNKIREKQLQALNDAHSAKEH
ncbi:hypothetical protein ACNDTC_004224 [Escherichia coli]